IQISTGAVSASVRNRASLSPRTFVFSRRSSIRAARNISGMEIVIRNKCSASTFSVGLLVAKGPCPWIAPEIDKNATINRDVLTPSGPNRTAAQRRNGRGRYTSAGTLPSTGVGQKKTPTPIAISPQPSRQASIAREALLRVVRAAVIQVRIAGVTAR